MPFVNINLNKKKNNFVVPEDAQIPSITVSLNSSTIHLDSDLIEEVIEKFDLTKAENASTLSKTYFFNSILNLDENSPDFPKIDDEKDKKSFLNLKIQSASKENVKRKRKMTHDGLPIYLVGFTAVELLTLFEVIYCYLLESLKKFDVSAAEKY